MITVKELFIGERNGIWQVVAIMSNGTVCRGFGISDNYALIDMMRANREYSFDWGIPLDRIK